MSRHSHLDLTTGQERSQRNLRCFLIFLLNLILLTRQLRIFFFFLLFLNFIKYRLRLQIHISFLSPLFLCSFPFFLLLLSFLPSHDLYINQLLLSSSPFFLHHRPAHSLEFSHLRRQRRPQKPTRRLHQPLEFLTPPLHLFLLREFRSLVSPVRLNFPIYKRSRFDQPHPLYLLNFASFSWIFKRPSFLQV